MVQMRGGTYISVGVNQTLAAQSQKQMWAMANIVAKTTIDPWQQVIAQIRHIQYKVSLAIFVIR